MAQETLPPPYQADDEILFEFKEARNCTEAGSACFQSCSMIVLRGVTKRVVGRGLLSKGDITTKGRLVGEGIFPGQYVTAKLVGYYATLEFETLNGSGQHSGWIYKKNPSEIWVNGVKVDDVLIEYGVSAPRNQKYWGYFPAAYLHFAARNPGSVGAPGPGPTPGENEIWIVTRNRYNVSNECGDHDGFTYGIKIKRDGQVRETAARVKFEAMAPIVMVHGINSSAGWFERMQPGFREPFDEVRAPVYVAPQYEAVPGKRDGYLSLGDGRIVGEVSERLVAELKHAAEEFGSDNVHVIAHSKGGLWTRHAIDQMGARDNDHGVYSLTTLDTPHHGSVLADFANYSAEFTLNACKSSIAYLIGNSPVPPSLRAILLCGSRSQHAESDPDLGPQAVADYNEASHLPIGFLLRGRYTETFYRTVGSDANLNDNVEEHGDGQGLGIIEVPSETSGWGVTEAHACPTLYWVLQTHKAIRWDSATGQITEIGSTTVPYLLNDFAVTVPSQFFVGSENPNAWDFSLFTPMGGLLGSPDQPLGRNHTSVGDDTIGWIMRESMGPALQNRTDPEE